MKGISFLGILSVLLYWSSCASIHQGQLVAVAAKGLTWMHTETIDTNLAILNYHNSFLRNYLPIHLVDLTHPQDTLTTNPEQKLYYLTPTTYRIIRVVW